MTPTEGEQVLRILRERNNGQLTVVELTNGDVVEVANVAWGRDDADDFDHVTANVSPDAAGLPIHVFFTRDVVSLTDAASREELFRSSS